MREETRINRLPILRKLHCLSWITTVATRLHRTQFFSWHTRLWAWVSVSRLALPQYQSSRVFFGQFCHAMRLRERWRRWNVPAVSDVQACSSDGFSTIAIFHWKIADVGSDFSTLVFSVVAQLGFCFAELPWLWRQFLISELYRPRPLAFKTN